MRDDLINIGLIPTEIVPHQVDGFDLILKYKTMPVISYANEWCSSMLRDAALLTCDIQLRLLESGCSLKGAHSWNVLFDASTPRYFDIGSIVAGFSSKVFLKDFRSSFFYPLLLKRANALPLVDATMSIRLQVPNLRIYRMLFTMIPMREWFYHRQRQFRIDKMWQRSPISSVKQLRKQIETIPDNIVHTEWTRYPHAKQSLDSKADWSAKMCAVDELLDKLRPKSVLDIGTNKGWYSELAESKGSHVIAADVDEFSLNELYNRIKTLNCDIHPLIFDVCSPMLADEVGGIFKPVQQRFRSEMVMMLAITHHLVQKRHRTFPDIAYYASSVTEKWALIEFVGAKDKHVLSWDRLQRPEYNISNFQMALQSRFSKVSVWRQIDDDRWLVLCAKP